MEKLIIIGGGGHAGVLIDLIRTSGQYEISGILDARLKIGSEVTGIPVLGNDDLLLELYDRGIRNACISVGSVKDNSRRKALYGQVKQVGFFVPSLLHPQACISKNGTKISEGVQIMAGAIVQTGSSIGQNTIINTGAIIEHDCKIGEHIHVSPGAVVSGECIINDGAFVGAGATIIHGIKIGKNSIVAAGAVVVNDVADGKTVMGVPARMVNA